MNQILSREFERKYLILNKQHLGETFDAAAPTEIEQYYLNQSDEAYEVRIRSSTKGASRQISATLKQDSLPDRLEIEATLSDEAYEYWQQFAMTQPIRKKRRTLALPFGHWALDEFETLSLCTIEAEGERVVQPNIGVEVTHNTEFRNYRLAEKLPVGSTKKGISMRSAQDEICKLSKEKAGLVIGIAGATASGKTTLARSVLKALGTTNATLLHQDDFYKGKTRLRVEHGESYEPNWDAPEALDFDELKKVIGNLKRYGGSTGPKYDMSISDPSPQKQEHYLFGRRVLLLEGIYALHEDIAPLLDVKVFVDAPVATRIGRRITRDVAEGRTFSPEDNLRYLLEVAEPTFAKHGKPQEAQANIHIST